jgi:arylsulfatase A-like enzyme
VPAGAVCSAVATSMDLFPTLARLAGASVPADRTIDGLDIGPLLFGETTDSPREAFWFYSGNTLEAVRSGRWKLHVAKGGDAVEELYDLEADVGETTDVSADHPDVVAALQGHADRARAELGDARLAREGAAVRPAGRVDDPVTLTTYDPDHPYYVAEYDLPDRG